MIVIPNKECRSWKSRTSAMPSDVIHQRSQRGCATSTTFATKRMASLSRYALKDMEFVQPTLFMRLGAIFFELAKSRCANRGKTISGSLLRTSAKSQRTSCDHLYKRKIQKSRLGQIIGTGVSRPIQWLRSLSASTCGIGRSACETEILCTGKTGISKGTTAYLLSGTPQSSRSKTESAPFASSQRPRKSPAACLRLPWITAMIRWKFAVFCAPTATGASAT